MGIWCFVNFQNLISKYNRPFCSTIQNVITFSSNYKQTPKFVKLQLRQHALPFCIHTTKIVLHTHHDTYRSGRGYSLKCILTYQTFVAPCRLKLHYRSSFHASELQKCNVWYLFFFLCVCFFFVCFFSRFFKGGGIFFYLILFFSFFLFGIKLFAKCSSIVIEISYGL